MQEVQVALALQAEWLASSTALLGAQVELGLLAIAAAGRQLLQGISHVLYGLILRRASNHAASTYIVLIQMSKLLLEVVSADNLPNIGLNRPPSAYMYRSTDAVALHTVGSSTQPISKKAHTVHSGATTSSSSSLKST